MLPQSAASVFKVIFKQTREQHKNLQSWVWLPILYINATITGYR